MSKKRTDPTINPMDKGNSYVDSVANAGTTKLGNLIPNSTLADSAETVIDEPLFNPGAAGVQTRPGDGGFAYIDNPTATVFIQKREWIEDDWNYVSNSEERDGKVEELQTRVKIGNLITRKLDLLNDHELFSKFSQYNSVLNSLYQNQVRSEDASKYTLDGSQVTKYYTEKLVLSDEEEVAKTADLPIATKVKVNTLEPGTGGRLLLRARPDYNAPVLTGFHGPKTGGPSPSIILNTTGTGGSLENPKNVIPGVYNIEGGKVKFDLPKGVDPNKYKCAQFWEVDLTKVPKEYILSRDEDQLLLGIEGVYGKKPTLVQKQEYIHRNLPKVGYVSRVAPGNAGGVQLAIAIEDLKIEAEIEQEAPPTQKPNQKTYTNVFNGVMELCNIQSIRTSLRNDGSVGSAELTLVNPNNMLVISDDDIEIAMSENPYLKSSLNDDLPQDIVKEVNGKKTRFKYYRGKYYTERGYKLVTRRDLSAIFPTTDSLSELEQLRGRLSRNINLLKVFLQGAEITNQTYEALSETYPEVGVMEKIGIYSDAPDRKRYQNQITTKIGQMKIANDQIDEKIKILKQQNLDSLERLSEASDESYDYRKKQLQKYFQNRTIFSVYDKIHIWMSSPSRTVRTLKDGTVVAEEFTSKNIRAKKVQEIVSLIKQYERIVQTIAARSNQTIPTIFLDNELVKINEQLFLTGTSDIYNSKISKVKEVFASNYPSELRILEKTLEQKIEQLKEFIKAEDAVESEQKLDTEYVVQGLDPQNIFSNEYQFMGTTDEQYQVFEGIITNISRSYSGGQFTIQISCQDSLSYLERSRFIDKPSMNQYAITARPVLDDPIWREVRDEFSLSKLSDSIKKALKTVAGRWKTGILSLNASFFDKKEEKNSQVETGENKRQNLTNTFPLEVLHSSFARPMNQAFTEAFAGSDPANIVSILTTGLPFDLDLYLRNSSFKGSLSVKPQVDGKTHDGEQLPIGPAEAVRQQIVGQYSKYGNFEPFIETIRDITEEEKNNVNTRTQLGIALQIVKLFKTYVANRKQLFPKAVQFDGKEYQKKESALNFLTKENFGEIIIESKEFPETVKTTKDEPTTELNPDFIKDIEKPIEFVLTAALRGEKIETVNSLMLQGIDENSFNQILKGSGAFFRRDKNRRLYALSKEEESIYKEVAKFLEGRIRQGQIYQILEKARKLGTAQFLEETFGFAKPQQAPVVDEIKSLWESRNKLFHTNPLQTTKASIIAKQKKNYLVISDKYISTEGLSDYVLQIYDQGQQENNYSTVLERCQRASKTIDYEFYADSQGHIRFKPPSYNRVFLRHFLDLKDIEVTYKQVLINYLQEVGATDLLKVVLYKGFSGEAKTLKQACYSILDAILQEIGQVQMASDANLFNYLTTFGSKSLLTTSLVLEPTSLLGFMCENVTSVERIRNIASQIQNIENSFATMAGPNPLKTKLSKKMVDEEVDSIMTSLISGDKETPDITNLSSGQKNLIFSKEIDSLKADVSRLKNEVSEAILFYKASSELLKDEDAREEQQRLNRELAQQVFKIIETIFSVAKETSDTIDYISQKINSLQGRLHPQVQEMTDTRFIHNVPSAIILSESYSENAPEFTRLDVYANPTIAGVSPSDITGQYMHWAGSVDYDLWRIYGLKQTSVQVPFLQNGQQATVYAHLLMARQYAKILQGNLTVRGDSKYQVGDCIFIEDENLYYYITGVQHDFTFGQQYTTSLTLAYGRRKNYAIPYPFDVIGKQYTRGANILYGDDSALFDSSALNQFIVEGIKQENESLKDPGKNT